MPTFSSATNNGSVGVALAQGRNLLKMPIHGPRSKPAESQFLPWVPECFVCILKFERQDLHKCLQ